jgi:hypothetical protein
MQVVVMDLLVMLMSVKLQVLKQLVVAVVEDDLLRRAMVMADLVLLLSDIK